MQHLIEPCGSPQRFGVRPDKWRHTLVDHPVFADDMLIKLIKRTPRERYHVNTMPRDAMQPQLWREGEMTGVSGRDVLAAVAGGNIWVHLKRVHETDGLYAQLLEQLFAEVEGIVPGLRTYRRSMSILLSSPGINVA